MGGAPRPLDLGLARRLARYLQEVQPTLVQANGSDTLKYGVLARWWSGGTWPLVYRNISVMSRWLRLPLQRLWVAGLLHQADHVAAVSRRSRQDLMDTFWLSEDRVTAIPIGTEVEPIYPTGAARAHLAALGNAAPDAPLLLHVGSYAPEKNHAWMLRAFERIRRHVPEAHLFLAGDGPLRPEVEAQIRRDGLAEAVHMLGSRDDVPRLMAGADLLLLPSRIEGIPGVILEAAAQGIPTVATDVGSIGEAVRDGATGRPRAARRRARVLCGGYGSADASGGARPAGPGRPRLRGRALRAGCGDRAVRAAVCTTGFNYRLEPVYVKDVMCPRQ